MYMFQVRAISVPTNPEDSSYRNDKLSGTVKTYPKKKPTIFSNNNQRWVSTHQGGHNCPVFYCVVMVNPLMDLSHSYTPLLGHRGCFQFCQTDRPEISGTNQGNGTTGPRYSIYWRFDRNCDYFSVKWNWKREFLKMERQDSVGQDRKFPPGPKRSIYVSTEVSRKHPKFLLFVASKDKNHDVLL